MATREAREVEPVMWKGLAHFEPYLRPMYRLSGHCSQDLISIPCMLMTTGSHTTVLLGDDGGEETNDEISDSLWALDEDALIDIDAATGWTLEDNTLEDALFDEGGVTGCEAACSRCKMASMSFFVGGGGWILVSSLV